MNATLHTVVQNDLQPRLVFVHTFRRRAIAHTVLCKLQASTDSRTNIANSALQRIYSLFKRNPGVIERGEDTVCNHALLDRGIRSIKLITRSVNPE